MRYIFIISLLLMFGCRSKQKATERTNESLDKKEVLDERERTRETVTANIQEKGYTYSDFFKTIKTGSFKQADPSKVIVIKDDSGRSYEVRGADFDLSEQRETNKRIDSFLKVNNSLLERFTDLERNYKLLLDEKRDSRTSDVEVESIPVWLWIVLIILVIFFILFFYRKVLPFMIIILIIGCASADELAEKQCGKILVERNCTIKLLKEENKRLRDSLRNCYKCLHKAHSRG